MMKIIFKALFALIGFMGMVSADVGTMSAVGSVGQVSALQAYFPSRSVKEITTFDGVLGLPGYNSDYANLTCYVRTPNDRNSPAISIAGTNQSYGVFYQFSVTLAPFTEYIAVSCTYIPVVAYEKKPASVILKAPGLSLTASTYATMHPATLFADKVSVKIPRSGEAAHFSPTFNIKSISLLNDGDRFSFVWPIPTYGGYTSSLTHPLQFESDSFSCNATGRFSNGAFYQTTIQAFFFEYSFAHILMFVIDSSETSTERIQDIFITCAEKSMTTNLYQSEMPMLLLVPHGPKPGLSTAMVNYGI